MIRHRSGPLRRCPACVAGISATWVFLVVSLFLLVWGTVR